MKKLFIGLAFIFAVISQVNSQQCFKGTTAKPVNATTCEIAFTNNGIDTLNLELAGDYIEVCTIQFRLTLSSGTGAGTVRLYGSNYGTTSTWDAVSDTLTLSNKAIESKTWALNKPCYKYYRILQSGGTTMAGTLSAKIWALKPR